MSEATINDPALCDAALPEQVLQRVRAAGAEALLTLSRKEAWVGRVANSKIEQLTSSVEQGLGLRVILADGRFAVVSSNDVHVDAVLNLTDQALAMAEASQPDPYRSLAPLAACGMAAVDGLDDGCSDVDADALLDDLLQAEAKALAADPRIIGSHRCSASYRRLRRAMWTSQGLQTEQAGTMYGLGLVLVAEHDGEKQMGHDSISCRNRTDLPSADSLVDEAVDKTLRGFGWQQARSGPVSVVLHHDVASSLLSVVGSLASGDPIFTKRSYWADLRDEMVASPLVSVVDDPLIAKGIGSRACDSEGVKAAPLTIVDQGRLCGIMADTYSANRLGIPGTGHSGGSSNLLLAAGDRSLDELLADMGTGLYVTNLHGHGVDITAGTWSKGATGFWVEDGKIVHPVQEVTLAGSLADMFKGITALGNDPKPASSVSAPSLLIEGALTLGGA